MLFNQIVKIFYSKDHKQIMLFGLYVSSVIIFISLAFLALYMNYRSIFYSKMAVAFLMTMLLYGYFKYRNTSLFAVLLLIVVEIDSSSAMISEHFYDFATIYPFFPILGFFFFFKLRTAGILTLIHFVYWAAVSAYGFRNFTSHPLFHMVPLLNMFTSIIVVILIALFYHISTEITYKKLEQANRQKEILIKEIHHRIKNNLNKIASILGLQTLSIERDTTQNAQEILTKSKLRIEAMAMVHDVLYKSDNLNKINFSEYTTNLTTLISRSYNQNITVNIPENSIFFSIDTVQRIGIIINELFTNSLKYAKPVSNMKTDITINLTKKGEKYVMSYLQKNTAPVDLNKLRDNSGLGIKLITLMVTEMQGTMSFDNKDGLKIEISFSD